MCIAIPAKIEELLSNEEARVRVGESEALLTVSLVLLPAPPRCGDYVIVHAGFAISTLTPEEADETLALFREMADLS